MKLRITLIIVLIVSVAGCMGTARHAPDEKHLEEIRVELEQRRCRLRMDSIAFEIEGLLFNAVIDSTENVFIMELLPDSLPVCPVGGEPYIFEESQYTFKIACPVGHGSVIIQKN